MSRFFLSVSGVVVSALILGCCGAGSFSTAPSKPSVGTAAPDPDDLSQKMSQAATVSAKELAAKYKDQATADAAYKDKWLVVDGEVEDVVASERFVTLRSDGNGLYVQCYFDEAWNADLAKLASGKPAKIGGRCTGRTGGNVVLKECFFPEAIPALVEAKKKAEAERVAREAEAKKKQEEESKKEEEARLIREKNAKHSLRKIEAWEYAKKIVTASLKSPSTASFGGLFSEQGPEACVNWVGEPDTYQVHGWVDAQNGFGATVRSDFLLTLEYRENGVWLLVDGPDIRQR